LRLLAICRISLLVVPNLRTGFLVSFFCKAFPSVFINLLIFILCIRVGIVGGGRRSAWGFSTSSIEFGTRKSELRSPRSWVSFCCKEVESSRSLVHRTWMPSHCEERISRTTANASLGLLIFPLVYPSSRRLQGLLPQLVLVLSRSCVMSTYRRDGLGGAFLTSAQPALDFRPTVATHQPISKS
jgi:hypothetical protein